MTRLVRQIHLLAGLMLFAWVLLYFITGYVMIHPGWFDNDTLRKQTATEVLHWSEARGTSDFVRHLEVVYGLEGQRQEPHQRGDGSWQFGWTRPRVDVEAVVEADGSKVVITQSENSTVGIMYGLHRLHGYGGGSKYDIWTFCCDITGAAMIIFSVSGILLWWRTTKLRWPGWACLIASFGFTGAMIAYMMFWV